LPAPGAGKKDGPERSRAWLYEQPAASHALLRALAAVCVDLLVGAWAAGASVLQVFESAAGELPPPLFAEFSLPYLRDVAAGVDASFASIHKERLAAYDGYLKAADPENVSRGMVFLGGNTAGGAAGYNPWALNAHATVRARVAVQDPLKTVLTKRAQEAVMLSGGSSGAGRSGTPPERAGVHERRLGVLGQIGRDEDGGTRRGSRGGHMPSKVHPHARGHHAETSRRAPACRGPVSLRGSVTTSSASCRRARCGA
jgi:hypothetical protein